MISFRRRRVIIAGLSAITAPAALSRSPLYAGTDSFCRFGGSGETLVLSGRVLDSAGKPLASAAVTVGHNSVATDADGRFVVVTTIRRAERLLYRVTRDRHAAVGFVFDPRRDTDGTWRATFALTLA